MKVASLAALTILTLTTAVAADRFPLLHVGDDSYTNVAVTSVTPTDLYFSHAGGMGNVKLKDLEADLQKHFKYNPTNAANIAKAQSEATKQFYMAKAAEKPPVIAPEPDEQVVVETAPPTNRPPGLRLETVKAKRFLGTQAPQLVVEKWITAPPATPGKFVLVNFWATWSDRPLISKLNDLQEKFNDRLVIISLSDESESAVKLMTSPPVKHSLAIDTRARMKKAVEVTVIPHAILMDKQGIARFEGDPQSLSEEDLAQLLTTYAE